MYLKSETSLEKYEPTTKQLYAYLSLFVCGLYQDQLMVVFYATFLAWYHSNNKADKIRTSKIFELVHR